MTPFSTRLQEWGCRAHQRAPVLFWVPVFVAIPLFSLADTTTAASAQVALLIATGAAAVTVTVVHRKQRQLTAYAVLATLVIAATVQGGEGWQALWGLVAITAPVVLRGWPLVGALTFATVGVAIGLATSNGIGGAYWPSVGGTLLSGIATTAVLRLIEANATLRATRAELARAAVAEERERVSRDLHDLLGHTLSVMVVKAEAVRRLAERDPGATAAHAADIETIGRTALADVRATVDGLRTLDLSTELDRARDALSAAGIDTEVTATVDVPVTPGQTLAWVVREATTNVLRHSAASTCALEVRGSGATYRVTVMDDGIGGPARPDPDRSGGLDGLRRRLDAAGGTLEADGTDAGFRVEATVPVP